MNIYTFFRTFFSLMIIFLSFICSFSSLHAQSVLQKGEWYKLKVSKDGIHKITAQNLAQMGFNLSAIDPKKIAIYGNGGGMLPQANSANRPLDLIENVIFIKGEEDGKFDNEDYILFHAQAADAKKFAPDEQLFLHTKNIYEDFNYYFITLKTDNGKRLTNTIQPNSGTEFRVFDEMIYLEKDNFNVLAEAVRNAPGGSGRDWYNDFFDLQANFDYNFDVTGIQNSKPLKITVRTLAYSTEISKFKFKIGEKTIGEQSIPASYDNTYARKGNVVTSNFSLTPTDFNLTNTLKLSVFFTKTVPISFGATDFFVLNFAKELKLYGNQTHFRVAQTANLREAKYVIGNIANAEQTQIWDITEPYNAQAVAADFSAGNLSFSATTNGQIREYIAFSGSDFPLVDVVGKVPNQNIKGATTPDLIIFTHPDFLSEAIRLADFRNKNDKLDVLVCTTEQVYNEFSSGKQDVTAFRDCIRYFYLKNRNKMKYALMFGDASFDYKNRMALTSNFVPIYESRESLNPIFSFSSEDYFGLMDEKEGEWLESSGNEADVEVAIGRIPAHSATNAKDVVNKLINYTKTDALGEWRKRICLVADDGDRNLFQNDSEKLANYIDSAFSAINVRKVYIDAYPKTATENGKRALIAQEKLNNYAENGSLIVNYMGHGSEVAWAQEFVLDASSITNWQNEHNLPFFFTGTCEFGRYDNPYRISGGESIITSPNAGIGLVTTTRPVFAETNFTLAKNFYDNVFRRTSGKFLRIGDIFRATKNASLNLANRNFSLLCDPSLRLAFPQDDVVITEILDNGQNTSQLKALSKITVRAEVRNAGLLSSNFNGTAEITVFDKPAVITTLGDDAPKMSFLSNENIIYRGIVLVKNGKMSFQFVVPKDINYRVDFGRISIYAADPTNNNDAVGAKSILVGSSNSAPIADNQAPKIQLFVENEAFISGKSVPANTQFIAYLNDENGINTTGIGIGHDIVAVLRGASKQDIVLNEFYETIDGDFTKGKITFPLRNLPVGKYTLTLTAWDTYNNSGATTVEFFVESAPIAIDDVIAAPNPFADGGTTISFKHDRIGDELEVTLLVFDMMGRPVAKKMEVYSRAQALINVEFAGTDNDHNPLPNGLYVARLQVRSLTDNQIGTKTVKLIAE